MSKFAGVLKNRNFFLLWIGQLISQLGDRLDQMALIAFVYMRSPGSTIGIAKILSFTIIPVFLIGPLAGVYVDRWDRRKTMYACDFLRSLLVLTIPLFLFYSKSLIPIYMIIFVIFCVGRFFVPAKLSIIPDLVDSKDLLIANSLINITGMIAAIVGFGVSGILVEWLGAKSGFYLDSLSFAISGLMIFFIANKAKNIIEVKNVSKEIASSLPLLAMTRLLPRAELLLKKSVFSEIKDGILYFVKNRDIRFAAGVIFVLWSALGAVYVVLIAFVQKTLQSATKDLGLLVMFLGGGLFVGSLIYGRFGSKFSPYKTIFISLILSGIMLFVFAMGIYHYPNFWAAAGLSFLLGLIISPIMIASNTIIHNSSENLMLGKIFSSLEIVMHLGFILFMFISSFLADKFSEVVILEIAGVMIVVSGIINLLFSRKILQYACH